MLYKTLYKELEEDDYLQNRFKLQLFLCERIIVILETNTLDKIIKTLLKFNKQLDN